MYGGESGDHLLHCPIPLSGMTWLPLDSSGVVRLQRNCGTQLNPLKCEKMIY